MAKRGWVVGLCWVTVGLLGCPENGINGVNGLNGSSCTIQDTVAGARILCQDGTSVEILDGAPGPPGSAGAPGVAGPPGGDGADGGDGVGCSSSLMVDGYEMTCPTGSLYVDTMTGISTQLNDVAVNANDVVLTASKKNGGAGGSRWFDATATLEPTETLVLPNSIPAVGNPGNGQKLYVLFDGVIDCAWFSGGGSYNAFRCFTGATRNGGTPAGFEGGTEVFLSEVDDVGTIEMTVAGAQGSGVITTATATFAFAP